VGVGPDHATVYQILQENEGKVELKSKSIREETGKNELPRGRAARFHKKNMYGRV